MRWERSAEVTCLEIDGAGGGELLADEVTTGHVVDAEELGDVDVVGAFPTPGNPSYTTRIRRWGPGQAGREQGDLLGRKAPFSPPQRPDLRRRCRIATGERPRKGGRNTKS
ncbi:unnamed protein product [Musa hybrid cultivar]